MLPSPAAESAKRAAWGAAIVRQVADENAALSQQLIQLAFRNHDDRDAADEIRQGAAYLTQEADQASRETQAMLLAAAQELTQLAARVEGGTVTAEAELGPVFARADQALAATWS